MIKVYVETSAADFFISTLTGQAAEATRRLQLSKGRELFISTTVLWELLQNNDRKDLDACLYMASCLFHNHLLKSAGEIFIDFIEKGCPSYLILDSPFTNSDIDSAWFKACNDKSYSFFIDDPGFIKITSILKKISQCMRYITHDRSVKHHLVDDEIEALAVFVDIIYESQFEDLDNRPVVKWLHKISIVLLYIYVCLCADISGDVINKYWMSKGISEPQERLEYVLKTYPDILKLGPLWNIANVILNQCMSGGRSSRGAFHDGLHSIYLPFVDMFLTGDEHFRKMRDRCLPEYKESLYHKIYHIDEIQLTRVEHS